MLTEASISGKVDHLRGLKENVTMVTVVAPVRTTRSSPAQRLGTE